MNVLGTILKKGMDQFFAQALVQGLDVRKCHWYYEYRQTIFKLIEDAEEKGATGLCVVWCLSHVEGN